MTSFRCPPARYLQMVFVLFLVSLTKIAICYGVVHPTESPAAQSILIDVNGNGPVFEGIGAVSAGASYRLLIDYPEPERSQILNYLFKPGYSAALQHLKVEIGSDVNSTDGSEPSHMRSPDDHNYSRGDAPHVGRKCSASGRQSSKRIP